MKLESILSNYLNQPKIELGDRSLYIGASDVGQCPRKVVLSKTVPGTYDLQTLLRFERGNVVEKIIERALIHSGIDCVSQLEVKHPEEPFTAHMDFTFLRDNGIAVLETKSVSTIPDDPYPSWIAQLYFQMGLVDLQFHLPTRGAIVAVELNSGEFRIFNGYTHNQTLFQGLLERAGSIWETFQTGTSATTEKSHLCIYCQHRSDCPEFSTEGLPDLPIADLVMDYQAAKEQEKQVKAHVSRLRKDLEVAVQPYGQAKAGDYSLKLGFSSRTSFDTKAFSEEHPDLAQKFMKTSSFSRLYVS